MRVPSWTDRILYEKNADLGAVFYGRSELLLSDHRPVFALFEVKIRKVNEDLKVEIEEKIIDKYM